jgi:phospholipid/cholesterol/gamma-HCH transport system ATP-binding protein
MADLPHRNADRESLVLSFEKAWLPTADIDHAGLALDLSVRAGDLVIVEAADDDQERALADAACGLLAPTRGAVRFMGHDWASMAPDRANALRGRIGCAFGDGAWIRHLTLLENIVLPQLHHTRRPVAEVQDEAVRLAVQFGLPGVPVDTPDTCTAADLYRSVYVRAFMGQPLLVVMDSAAVEAVPEIIEPLLNAANSVRERQAGVLWLTRSAELCFDRAIPATQRLQVSGNTIVASEVEI